MARAAAAAAMGSLEEALEDVQHALDAQRMVRGAGCGANSELMGSLEEALKDKGSQRMEGEGRIVPDASILTAWLAKQQQSLGGSHGKPWQLFVQYLQLCKAMVFNKVAHCFQKHMVNFQGHMNAFQEPSISQHSAHVAGKICFGRLQLQNVCMPQPHKDGMPRSRSNFGALMPPTLRSHTYHTNRTRQNGVYMRTRAMLLERMGRYKEAILDFKAAVPLLREDGVPVADCIINQGYCNRCAC
eukprot:366111-Chlamydomonas_euryale.AAC.4